MKQKQGRGAGNFEFIHLSEHVFISGVCEETLCFSYQLKERKGNKNNPESAALIMKSPHFASELKFRSVADLHGAQNNKKIQKEDRKKIILSQKYYNHLIN